MLKICAKNLRIKPKCSIVEGGGQGPAFRTSSSAPVRANVSQKMFPDLSTVGNINKHRQETMFPQ